MLLLFVDRLTALFSIFPSSLLFSFLSLYLPEGAHRKTELCVYASAYVDVQRRGKAWDGPVVLFDFPCPSPFRYHYIRGERDETILVHNHSSFYLLPLLVFELISTLLRTKCERDRPGCPARTNMLEVRLENACGISKMQLIFSRVTTPKDLGLPFVITD